MTKSMPPSSFAHRAAASLRFSGYTHVSDELCKIWGNRSSILRMLGVGCAHLANIAPSNANDLGTGANSRDILGSLLRLLHVATDDAGIGTQAHQCPGLHAADCACAARHKDDTTLCNTRRWLAKRVPQPLSSALPGHVWYVVRRETSTTDKATNGRQRGTH